jgi:peptidoglycan/xylan/chitin deacetylase (PgdA/CDA1 family)
MRGSGFRNIVRIMLAMGICMPLVIHAQVLRKPVPDKLVVLSFDDAVLSHATEVAPLLKKYGFGATFFVCEFKDPPFSDKTKYMSWEQIAQLHKMGFEIGNHTQNHTHVNKMDSTRFAAELDYIENKCKEYGIPKPVSFAYPGYDTSPKAIKVLKAKGYQFARAGWDRVYDPTFDHPYLIPGFTSVESNSKAIYDALNSAKDGKITVLTIHGVPDVAHPWVNTPPQLFEGYLKYMHDNHFTVIAMRDLKKYINVDKALEITPVFKPNKPQ